MLGNILLSALMSLGLITDVIQLLCLDNLEPVCYTEYDKMCNTHCVCRYVANHVQHYLATNVAYIWEGRHGCVIFVWEGRHSCLTSERFSKTYCI